MYFIVHASLLCFSFAIGVCCFYLDAGMSNVLTLLIGWTWSNFLWNFDHNNNSQ